jgi:hypothetical protein
MSKFIYFLGMRLEYWTLIIAGIAILFTALKDFILPFFIKPRLKITYFPKEPYKRSAVFLNSSHYPSVFDRFKIENKGQISAKNCRCQIYCIKNKQNKVQDLQGFPLAWASRPDFVERLNIGKGESEFVDLVHMRSDDTTQIFLNSYHNVPVGMPSNVSIDDYFFEVIISGDNFNPYIARFEVLKQPTYGGFKIKLLGVRRK